MAKADLFGVGERNDDTRASASGVRCPVSGSGVGQTTNRAKLREVEIEN
jgi:hypothetical protein